MGKLPDLHAMYIPADVIKVRLQLARNRAAAEGGAKPLGMVQTGVNVVKNEGVLALWSGLGPSLARGLFFGGARLGLYTPIKTMLVPEGQPSLNMKVRTVVFTCWHGNFVSYRAGQNSLSVWIPYFVKLCYFASRILKQLFLVPKCAGGCWLPVRWSGCCRDLPH